MGIFCECDHKYKELKRELISLQIKFEFIENKYSTLSLEFENHKKVMAQNLFKAEQDVKQIVDNQLRNTFKDMQEEINSKKK